jgi:hypothetical protein
VGWRTAGTQLWPLGAWAEDRAALIGPVADEHPTEEAVVTDLAVVLRTMQEWDAAWYAGYVERPLGRKWAPVVAQALQDPNRPGSSETVHLELVPRHERYDAWLAEAAAACLATIRAGIAVGEEPHRVVVEALTASFLSVSSLCAECDRAPLADGDTGAVVATVLADPAALNRVVETALGIVA